MQLIEAFLGTISTIIGPFALIAFLAVIFLTMFKGSTKGQRGLEYIYNLFRLCTDLILIALFKRGRDPNTTAQACCEALDQNSDPDWCWLRNHLNSPWYLSARQSQQPSPGSVPKCASGWFHQAATAFSQHHFADARFAVHQCLSKTENHADALNLAAVLDFRDGHILEAWNWICRATMAAPNQPDMIVNQGRIAMAMGNAQTAQKAFERALALAPKHLDALIYRAKLFLQTGRNHQALNEIKRLVHNQPESVPLVLLMSRLARSTGNSGAALKWARKATVMAPSHPEAWNQLGVTLVDSGAESDAGTAFVQSLALDPHQAAPRVNQALLCLAQGEVSHAMALLDDAVALAPEAPNVRLNRAQVLLLTESWLSGWRDYEYRCRCLSWRWSFSNPDHLPIWQGESFSGERLCIMADQGYGDLIQMIRLASMVKARGGDVVVVADPRLHPVLVTVPGVDTVTVLNPNGRLAIDCHKIVPVMSLPHILQLDPTRTIPTVYMTATANARERWPELADCRLCQVGLVWAGNPNQANDRRRSMVLTDLIPVLETPGIRWVSLQIGPPAKALARSPFAGRILDLGSRIRDFGDTAAAMAMLDGIITVDTAAAHMAGALGRPVWTILSWIPDWRWGLTRTDSVWYPSMRLFRQQRRDDWSGPVTAIAKELARKDHDSREVKFQRSRG